MFYLINKQKGISSFKAIKDFARENQIKKIGHTGTLDPLASGLLLVATDEDTKLIEYIDKGYKTYIATMKLGESSTTYDIEGEITAVSTDIPSEENVIKVLNSFVGFYDQMPPSFSAKKINGIKAYDLARNGQEVQLKPVRIEIKEIKDIKKISEAEYQFEVTVSRGTYIRSLIHDAGEKLGCHALMTDLIRNKIGAFDLVDKPTKINVNSLITLPITKVEKMKDLMNGKIIESKEQDGIYALEFNDDIVGVVEVKNKELTSKKLLGNKIKL